MTSLTECKGATCDAASTLRDSAERLCAALSCSSFHALPDTEPYIHNIVASLRLLRFCIMSYHEAKAHEDEPNLHAEEASAHELATK